MTLSLTTALLSLHLLASAPSEANTSSERATLADERRIELTADSPGQVGEVRIGPNQASNLMFNAPLRRGSVTVQEREFFHSVMVDESAGLITLLPSAQMPSGKAVLLAVGFADNRLPENTTFRLVVYEGQAERQVRVERKPRSADSFQEEARQERQRAEHCEAALGRQATRPCQKDLVSLFDAGLVKKGIGIRALDFLPRLPSPPIETLSVAEAYGYRAIGRVAVELWVDEAGQPDWPVGAAELLDENDQPVRVLRTWRSPGKLHPGELRQVVVEAEAPDSSGPFLLRLKEAQGPRTLTVRGVMFP